MCKAIKIEDLPPLDDTATQVLRAIVREFGEQDEGFIKYRAIAEELKIPEYTVSKAIRRLEAKNLVKINVEKRTLKLLNTVNVAD